jgi:hypothetical protein
VLEEIRHHHLFVGVSLQLERDPHIVRRQILDVDERRQLAAECHFGDPLDERRLVHGVRHARDVNRFSAASDRAFLPRRAQADGAGPGLVNLLQFLW